MKKRTNDIPSDENTISIVLATDVHLGYKHDDDILGGDSFKAMEETFQIAERDNADLLLLGGDLFEKNNPKTTVMDRTVNLFKKYVVGKGDIKLKLLSDPVRNFGHTSDLIKQPHWTLPWLSVKKPVLSVHGNHDNPTGVLDSSAIDLLAEAGLLSHFGRNRAEQAKLKHNVYPVILQKGKTKIAIYGWGYITDQKFRKMLDFGHINFVTPKNVEEYFNIMVIHQNRGPRSSRTDFFPEDEIPDFIDYCLWGHEHDQKFEVIQSNDVLVDQPGSTVVTSLCDGETSHRRIGVLKIHSDKKNRLRWQHFKVPLECSRIFIFRTITLSDHMEIEKNPSDLEKKDQAMKLIIHEVEDMKDEADKIIEYKRPNAPKRPLLRLRIVIEENLPKMKIKTINIPLLKYAANKDIASYRNPNKKKLNLRSEIGNFGKDISDGMFTNKFNILPFLECHFVKEKPMEVLSEVALTKIVQNMVDECIDGERKGYSALPGTIEQITNHMVDQAHKDIMKQYDAGDMAIEGASFTRDVERLLIQLRQNHLGDWKPDDIIDITKKKIAERKARMKSPPKRSKPPSRNAPVVLVPESDEEDEEPPPPRKTARRRKTTNK